MAFAHSPFVKAIRLALASLAWLVPQVASAQLPANTDISNQAAARYVSGIGGDTKLISNTVRAVPPDLAPKFKILKSVSASAVEAGQEVTFTVTARETTAANPAGLNVIVDGQAQTLLLLRDMIPAQTQFVRFEPGSAAAGTPLYHRAGDPRQTYATTPPGDLRAVDAVALGFAAFPQAAGVTLKFTVRLDAIANGAISNTAQLYAIAAPSPVASATASNTVRLTAMRPADPFGIVFDAESNAPIGGARVTLIDASTGQPAQVYNGDGTNAANSVITKSDGRYSFPLVAPGSYRLEVLPPPGYNGPSKIGGPDLPAGRNVDRDASYSRTFRFDPSTGRFTFDIPLDRIAAQAAGLFLQKLASRDTAEIGDVVEYTLRIKNVSGRALDDVEIDDRLPHGFVYDGNSARIESGKALRNAGGERGPRLKFSLGTIPADGLVTLTYRTKIGVDAPQGDGINRAQARNSGTPNVRSNVATARVQIEPGVFTTRGIIVGKIFADLNANRIQDAGEPGVPGIRFYLEDGSYVISDSEGKYDFYGLTPRLHVLKLDKLTLPRGAELEVLDTRNAGTAGTRFVDLKNSELHKANFAIQRPSTAVLARIEALRVAAAKLADESDRSLRNDLTREGQERGLNADRRALPASGVLVPGAAVQATQEVRSENAGSLILNDARMQTAPSIQRGEYGQPMIPNLPRAEERSTGILPVGPSGILPGEGEPVRNAGEANTAGRMPAGPTGWEARAPKGTGSVQSSESGRNAPIRSAATFDSTSRNAKTTARVSLNSDNYGVGTQQNESSTHRDGVSSENYGVEGENFGTQGTRDSVAGYSSGHLASSGSENAAALAKSAHSSSGNTPSSFAPGSSSSNHVTPERASAEANSASFDPVLPSGGAATASDLTLFDVDQLPQLASTPAIPLENAVAALRAPTKEASAAAKWPVFLDLRDGDTLPMAQANVRVQGLAGGALRLTVNGAEVPESRVGKRVTMADRGLEALEFIGVTLRPGINELALAQTDPFGNPRGAQTIRVTAPDKLGKILIERPAGEQPADGNTPARVIVRLVDEHGVPVTARTELTLEASLGIWDARDLNETSAGVQVFIEGGRAEFHLQPPIEPGDARVRVSSGVLRAEETIAFLPDLRPLIAAGLVEGRVNISHLNSSSLTRVDRQDTFDQELREFSVGGNESSASARTAFFIKGKIKGNYLLTAAYDSERETRERLFRDIQPDEFYPVYGDSAVKGFEAQSTGPLYVRVDNKKSYLLYGDFVTQATGDFRQLGTYNRSLTGVKEHFENSRVAANAWASYDSTRQVIEELRANGTSGPYFFQIRSTGGIANSEKVEILTRDRNNSGLIIKTEGRTRFSDYEIEPFSGRLLFKAPIPSLDENLNPISIRVTYEADQGGPKFWTYGGDAQVKVTEHFELGGSAVREENPLSRFSLYSGNGVYQLAKNTFLLGEWARSEDELLGTGNAYRMELRHLSEGVAARVFWGRAERGFYNPSAVLQSGRTEGGAQVAVSLGKKTRLLIEGVDSEAADGGERRGATAAIEQTFGKDVRVEVGGRYSRESGGPASFGTALVPDFDTNEVRSVRAKLTLPVPWTGDAARIFGEYEQDVFDSDKRLAALGGDYQLDQKTRLYARHELISSLGGPFELNNVQRQNSTVVGVESTYMKDAQLFNEYRARNGISGLESEAAVGLRNSWPLAPGLRAQTSFERIAPLSLQHLDGKPKTDVDAANNSIEQLESTAVTGAIEYTAQEDWKTTARLELRTSQQTDSLLNTLGIAWRLQPDWTFLGKTILYLTDNKTAGAVDQNQGRIQLGLAWRETERDRWNALGKYEFKRESGVLSGGSLGSAYAADGALTSNDRQVHIVSLDVNFQPNADLILSGHYAGKLAYEESTTTSAHLVAGRAIYDLTRKFDVGINASALVSEGAVRYGVGPEIGYTLHDNLRAGIGYNFVGFTDRDLSEEQYTQQGVYLALRWKFDEETFQPKRREEDGK